MPCLRALIVAGCAVPALAAEPVFEQFPLFEAGTGGYETYRIPGLVVTAKGTVLAYCEARKSASGDWGPIDILLRRSEDRGKTWSAPQKVGRAPKDFVKNPVALKQKLAKPDDVTMNNATAIADRSGAIHFLYCIDYARCFYCRSDDDGKTFGDPLEITNAFAGFRPDYDWKVLATGPAHGIQLKSGRLAAAVWMSTGTGGHGHRPSAVATIYSDDGGKTWLHGAIIARHDAEFINPNETCIVELPDGRVMVNMRSESPQHRRLLSCSADGAAGWTKPAFHEQLLEPVCMGSTVRLDDKRILFANPDNLLVGGKDGKPGKNRDRRNLTVKVSEDGGKTWPLSRAVEPGLAGYSDLAVGPDGTIYCLYERGDVNGRMFHTRELSLARFNSAWLTARK